VLKLEKAKRDELPSLMVAEIAGVGDGVAGVGEGVIREGGMGLGGAYGDEFSEGA
jgi:hypothetical protein